MRKLIAVIVAVAMLLGSVALFTACGDDAREPVTDGETIVGGEENAGNNGTGSTEEDNENNGTDGTEEDNENNGTGGTEEDNENNGTGGTEEDTGNNGSGGTEEDTGNSGTDDGGDDTEGSDTEGSGTGDGEEGSDDNTESHEHEFTGDWVAVSESGHARECAHCDEIDENLVAHTYEEEFGHNAEGHWQICETCGYETAVVSHRWNDGSVITAPAFLRTGEAEYTCLDCGETKNEEIPALLTANFAEEFSVENQDGAWRYGYVDYSWEGGESFVFHAIEALNDGGDGWQSGGAEIKSGWINADSMTTIAYTFSAGATVAVNVEFAGGTEYTRLALRIGVKNSEGELYSAPTFDADGESNLLNVQKTFTLNAGDTVYFIFSNEGKVEGAYPNGTLNITLTKQV